MTDKFKKLVIKHNIATNNKYEEVELDRLIVCVFYQYEEKTTAYTLS